ncbi:hypothetical protein [Devosia sp.]|uniref:hypothetical protein n=1 Tax=Devosia sp. TaxID=1871048 RepID=UPI0027352ADF|nr:hypothetical protein [Devosia sp.]MDP2779760.1 hypothetical protein [Devosia sp.]
MIRVGTKSLCFGVHQVLLHPLFVFLAWRKLYGWPSWREAVCIVIHDWGYWQAPNMDGPEGEAHPWVGAMIARRLFGTHYLWLCLLHSRHLTRALGMSVPSRLCWADKAWHDFMPAWLFVALAHLSGEFAEYRRECVAVGLVEPSATDIECYRTLKQWIMNGLTQDDCGVSSLLRGKVEA